MGRSRIRGTPSRRNRPLPSATIAVKNRIVVPELATNNSADEAGINSGDSFVTETDGGGPAQSADTRNPSARRQLNITIVSSLHRTPQSSCGEDCPVRAANTIARFVMLFDPGTRAVAFGG